MAACWQGLRGLRRGEARIALLTEAGSRYFMVKLVKGPEWTPGLTLGLFVLQLRHMWNLRRLRRMKRAVLSGPLSDGGEVRGIVILLAESEDEAQRLIESDPAVRAGRLSFQIGPF
jgi:uncharacterized protein YciI